jgi:hypothetical protein
MSSEYMAAYDVLVRYFKADVKVKRWRTYQGAKDDSAPWSTGNVPGIMLFPTVADSGSHRTPDGLGGQLVVLAEVVLSDPDARKLFEIWYSLKRAVYPTSRTERAAIRTAIAAAAGPGVATGEVKFQGFSPVQPDGGALLIGRGRIVVDVYEQLLD